MDNFVKNNQFLEFCLKNDQVKFYFKKTTKFRLCEQMWLETGCFYALFNKLRELEVDNPELKFFEFSIRVSNPEFLYT